MFGLMVGTLLCPLGRMAQATESPVTTPTKAATERLMRLAGQWVVPIVLASRTELPEPPAGVSVTGASVTGGNVSLDGRTIVSTASVAVDATVAATIAYDGSAETVARRFQVTVLPAGGSRAVLAYDRTPTSAAEANNADVAHSMHLALDDGAGWAPLYDNYGIFFAKTSEEPGPLGTSPDIIRSLVDPHLFYLANGDFGVVATRVARDGGPDGTQASSILFARSPDLLSYEEVGLVDVGVTNGVHDPAAIYDSSAGHYLVTWRSDAGEPMSTTFTDLADESTRGDVERGAVAIVGDGASGTGVDDFRSGSSLPVTAAIAEALRVRFGPIVNTGARPLKGIDLEVGDRLDVADLPRTIDLDYSDGSTGNLAIEWSAGAIAAVETSVPGKHVVDGRVRQTVYPTPFADERADPSVFKLDWNGTTKFLMIATKDLNLDPINNAGQPTGMPLRVADSIEDLSDEAIEAGRNREVDLLVRGSVDAHGGVMTGCFWAPELHMIGGTLSILFMPCYGDKPDMWTGRASIIQLEKDGEGHHLDPAVPGNWTRAEHVVRVDGSILNDLQRISLDMTYFEDSGRSYYAWQMLGSVFIATMDPANPSRLTSDPVRIIAPLYAWDNTIAEGPNVHVHNGKLFMLYSGSMVGDTYTTGLATATAGEGVDLTDPAAWTRLSYPIQKSGPYNGEMQLGTGHGMWSEDEDGNLLYVFHARTSHKGLTGRDMFVRRVHWAADGMPVLDMETDEELLPELRAVSVTVTVVP